MDLQAAPSPSVFKNRAFMLVVSVAFVSNTGRWMQQVILGILAWEMSQSAVLTTQVIFAQFIPMLVIGPFGGALADIVDRRLLLIGSQLWQAVWALILAFNLMDGQISAGALLLLVFVGALSMGLYAPALSAAVPSMVGRDNMPTAISLNSAQINGSRVVGPVIGAWLASATDIWVVILVNGFGFLFASLVLTQVAIPRVEQTQAQSYLQRFKSGFRIASRAEQIRVPLLLMATFALFCLPFIGLLPVIAEVQLGIRPRSPAYGWLYAVFGLGAMVGAGAVGTVLRRFSSQMIVRVSLVGFAGSLALLASLRAAPLAYPVMFAVGMFYFTMPTALTTFMQMHLEEVIRGRIMSLWMLSFGGVVPITNLLAGPAVEATSLTLVLSSGAVAAVALAAIARLRPGPQYGELAPEVPTAALFTSDKSQLPGSDVPGSRR